MCVGTLDIHHVPQNSSGSVLIANCKVSEVEIECTSYNLILFKCHFLQQFIEMLNAVNQHLHNP